MPRIPLPRPRPYDAPQSLIEQLFEDTQQGFRPDDEMNAATPNEYVEKAFPDVDELMNPTDYPLIEAALNPNRQETDLLQRNDRGMNTRQQAHSYDTNDTVREAAKYRMEGEKPYDYGTPTRTGSTPADYIMDMFPSMDEGMATPADIIQQRFPRHDKDFFETPGQIYHRRDELPVTEQEAALQAPHTAFRQFMGAQGPSLAQEDRGAGIAPEVLPDYKGRYLKSDAMTDDVLGILRQSQATPFDNIQQFISRMFGR